MNTIRRVLDAMFTGLGQSQLTHKLPMTLMAEVVAIVNARPIAALPSEVDDPQPLSPAMLLTMKTRPAEPLQASSCAQISTLTVDGGEGLGGGESTCRAYGRGKSGRKRGETCA